MAVLSALTAGFAGQHQHSLGAAVGFGAPDGTGSYNQTAFGASIAAVGQISGPVEINMNPSTIQVRASILRGPYDEIITGVDPQITFSMDAFSLWNIALGMSVEQDAVSGSSILGIDMTHLKNHAGIVDPDTLTNNAIANIGFSACELLTATGGATASAAHGTMAWQLWKCKVFSNGAISVSGEAMTQVPIRVQVFGSDSDKAGQVVNSVTHTIVTYEA